MNRDEILKEGEYYQQSDKTPLPVFRINLFVPIFNKKVKIEAFNLESIEGPSIQLILLVEMINEILNYNISNIEWIKDEVWKHFNSYMTNSSYNMIDYSKFSNDEEANRAYFYINDKELAYNKVELELIHFDLNQTEYRHFNLCFNCPWEMEHGITMCIIDGELDYVE